MPFERATSVVPTSIRRIDVTIYDENSTQGADYRISVLDQSGTEIRVRGDLGNLVPLLSGADLIWLRDFIQRMRTKATTELLGQ